MSSNKDDNAAIAGGIGLIIGLMYVMALVMFAFAAIAALILTVIAVFAWNKPVTLGNVTVQSEDARAFVQRGVIGAALLPLVIAICAVFLDLAVDWSLRPYFMIAGYTIGSLGIEYLIFKHREQSAGAMRDITSCPPAVPVQHRGLPAPAPAQISQPLHPSPTAPAAPFRFASWDDETGA